MPAPAESSRPSTSPVGARKVESDHILRGNDFARSLAGAEKPLGPVGKVGLAVLRGFLGIVLIVCLVAAPLLLIGTFWRGWVGIAGGILALALTAVMGMRRRR
jgi:hypothetical protein